MALTVLRECDIESIFGKLSAKQLQESVKTLEETLIGYSCRDGASYQPERGVVKLPGGQTSLFMPATTANAISIKIVGISAANDAPPATEASRKLEPGLKSVLTLCDAQGRATGILNAAGITAFRTALGSMLLFQFRKNVHNIVVFGAGKQALWHIRLAIMLRGQDVRNVTIINRSATRTNALISELNRSEVGYPSHIKIRAFEEKYGCEVALKPLLIEADAIFCTTPATEPLFPAKLLTSDDALKKPRYISAIGSYRLDMQELDPRLLRILTDQSTSLPFPTYKGGVIVVDSIEGCLKEAGEIVQAKLADDRMLELGRILQDLAAGQPAGNLVQWLEEGLVVYKSVGIGIMDLAVGQQLLRLAESREIGFQIEEF